MRDIDVRELLGAYASGILTPSEERRLHEAALDDQELFNALADEDLLREALEDPRFRQRLKTRLRALDDRSLRGYAVRLADWFRRPAVLVGAAPVVAALVIGIGLFLNDDASKKPANGFESFAPPGEMPEPQPESGPQLKAGIQDVSLERLWDRAVPNGAEGVELDLNRGGEIPEYDMGDWLQIKFSLSFDANVLLLYRHGESAVTQLFPDAIRPSATVRAGEEVSVPDEQQGYFVVQGPSGIHRLRLLVFAPGTDHRSPESETGRPRAVERQFRVVSDPAR